MKDDCEDEPRGAWSRVESMQAGSPATLAPSDLGAVYYWTSVERLPTIQHRPVSGCPHA